MELIPPQEGQSFFLVNHPSCCSNQRVARDKGWHEQLQGLWCEFGGHRTLFVKFLMHPISLDEETSHIVCGVAHAPKKFGQGAYESWLDMGLMFMYRA